MVFMDIFHNLLEFIQKGNTYVYVHVECIRKDKKSKLSTGQKVHDEGFRM